MRRSFTWAVCFIWIATFCSCDGEEPPSMMGGMVAGTSIAGDQAGDIGDSGVEAGSDGGNVAGGVAGVSAGTEGGASPELPKEWTVLLYSAADNDLERPMLSDIAELTTVGSSDRINLIIQVDRSAEFVDTPLVNIDPFIGAKRLAVSSEQNLIELEDLGVIDSGSADTLKDFIIWGVQRYPAEKYMLIMANHGAAVSGIAYDFDMSSHISLRALSASLRESLVTVGLERFDLIGFDACLMASIEVASMLSPFADLMVASANLEPGHGWDYRAFQLIKDAAGVSPEELGREIIRRFKDTAAQAATLPNATLALIDLTEIAALMERLTGYSEQLVAHLPQEGAREAVSKELLRGIQYGAVDHGSDQPFNNMYDLKTFVENTTLNQPELIALSAEMMNALERAILFKIAGDNFEGTSGLSIHFKPRVIEPLYDGIVNEVRALSAWRSLMSTYQSDLQSVQPPALIGDGAPQLERARDQLTLTLNFDPAGVGRLYHPETLLNVGTVGFQSCDYVLRYTSDDFNIDHSSGQLSTAWPTKRVRVVQGELSFEPHWNITKTQNGYRMSALINYIEGDVRNLINLTLDLPESFDRVHSYRLLRLGLNGASATELTPTAESSLELRQLCQIGAQPQGLTTLRSSAEVALVELTSPMFKADEPLTFEFQTWEDSENTFITFDYLAERFFTWKGKLNDL